MLTPLLDLGGHIGWLVALLSLLLIVGAGLAVRSVAHGKDPAVRVIGARMPSFDAGLGVDRLYVTLVARPVLALAHAVVFLDREVVDAYVRGAAAAPGSAARRAARAPRRAGGLRAGLGLAGVVAVALAGVALGDQTW